MPARREAWHSHRVGEEEAAVLVPDYSDAETVSEIPGRLASQGKDLAPGEVAPITGTLVWYYAICERETWLQIHAINPDEDDPNLAYGRFLQEQVYKRERKDLEIRPTRLDAAVAHQQELVVVEVKKSDRYLEAARLQLARTVLCCIALPAPGTAPERAWA